MDPESPVLSDAEVARNAVLDINIALDQIQNFKDNFVSFSHSTTKLSAEFSEAEN